MWWLILFVKLTAPGGVGAIKHTFWCVCYDVSKLDEHLNWWTHELSPHLVQVEQKQRKGDSFPTCLSAWAGTMVYLELRPTPPAPLILRSLVLDCNYTIGFPESLAYRQQIWGFLSLPEYARWILIINLFMHICWSDFSGELIYGLSAERKRLCSRSHPCHQLTNQQRPHSS